MGGPRKMATYVTASVFVSPRNRAGTEPVRFSKRRSPPHIDLFRLSWELHVVTGVTGLDIHERPVAAVGLEARSIMARSTGSRSWVRPRHCSPTLHGAGPSVRRDPAPQSRDSMESDWRTPRQLRTSCLFPGTTLRRELPWWPSRREIVPGDLFNAVTSGRASIRSTALSSKQIACIKTGAPCVTVDDVDLAATAGALDPLST